MMARMGWSGGPLGKNGIGQTEPVEAVGAGNGTLGLGYKPTRAKSRRDNRAKYKALTSEDENGQETVRYGTIDGSKFRVATLSPRGRPVATGDTIDISPNDMVSELVWWGEGVLGRAERTYPHPSGWTVEGACGSPSLDTLSVRVLTAVFRRKVERQPTCMIAWRLRIPTRIPWRELGLAFQGGLLTPRDYASYYKNILHRALFLRVKQSGGDRMCRCCGLREEHFAHLPVCHVLRRGVWLRLVALAKAAPESHGLKSASAGLSFVLLGTTVEGRLLPPGLLAFWLILWKFVIIRFTQVELENAPFDTDAVWKQALRRFAARVHAAVWKHKLRLLTARAQESPPPSPASVNKMLEPVAELDARGSLSWAPFMRDALKAVGIEIQEVAPPQEPPSKASNAQGVDSYLRTRKVSFHKAQEQTGDAPERESVPLVGEAPRYMWTLQRRLLVRKVKGIVTLYSRFSMIGTPEVQRIEAGAMLPLESNPTEDRTIEEVYEASRKACGALAIVQSRSQAFVFGASCDDDRAAEYVMDLWQAGWGDLQPVAELPKQGKDRIKEAVRKAFARYKSATLDLYSLRGPVARAATQVQEPPGPELSEIEPFEMELEIERELQCE